MKKLIAVVATFVMMAPACAGRGAAVRTVLVDYNHDQFASFVAANFPLEVNVHPGTEVRFRQTWTGEPHTITGGTMVNTLMDKVEPFLKKALRGEKIPDEPPADIAKLEKKLPFSYYEDEDKANEFNQTAAQPCYLAKRKPRLDGKPCDSGEQPEFTGTQSYYNSGIIPYEGPQGNEFVVNLADDIKTGSYWFYCNVHGEFQSTKVNVKPSSEAVDSPEEVSQRARKEIRDATRPLLGVYERAQKRKELRIDPEDKEVVVRGNYSGLFDPGAARWHSINEFVPKTLRARAGRKITWNLIGFHTISFGVPKYFPIITFEKDGTVKRNPKLDPPAGGANEYKAPPPSGPPDPSAPAPEFDGGTYDGRGFWSSGAIGGDPYLEYSMSIARPGTYKYACLIHPPMVGTITVTG